MRIRMKSTAMSTKWVRILRNSKKTFGHDSKPQEINTHRPEISKNLPEIHSNKTHKTPQEIGNLIVDEASPSLSQAWPNIKTANEQKLAEPLRRL